MEKQNISLQTIFLNYSHALSHSDFTDHKVVEQCCAHLTRSLALYGAKMNPELKASYRVVGTMQPIVICGDDIFVQVTGKNTRRNYEQAMRLARVVTAIREKFGSEIKPVLLLLEYLKNDGAEIKRLGGQAGRVHINVKVADDDLYWGLEQYVSEDPDLVYNIEPR